MNYPNLFQPIKIGNTLFRNRIFSAPLGYPDTIMGRFSDDVIAFFERKAKGGAACVTLGEAVVDSRYGKGYASELSLDSFLPRAGLSYAADAISRHGAIPSIELQHAGMKATPGLTTFGVGTSSENVYGPSACEFNGHKVLEMPEDLIYETIEKYADAAKTVQNAGFGMVTVHGGHSWLINQFMAERLNHRTDKWGGSMENRARMAVEICDAIHRRCGRGFPVEVRISVAEGLEGGYTAEEGIAFAKQLVGHADLIHCSVGCGTFLPDKAHTNYIMVPSMFRPDGVNVKYAAAVKAQVQSAPIATVGALTDPAMMEEIIASGKADIVEVARGLICDPDLPNKARSGRDDEIVHCMRCYTCYSSGMQRGPFVCALNPETARERSFARINTPAKPQKVLVAGGGIAGIQAALTAAKNGHDVILCEKSDHLGGHIRCEEKVPFKKHLKEYLDQQERRINAAENVEVHLNTEVTPAYARAVGADAIIAALGAKPVKPPIPGIDGKNVFLADDVYVNAALAGASAVILGGGLVGMELAIYLNLLGKKVQVVEMADGFHPFPNVLHGEAIITQMEEVKMTDCLHFSTKAIRIDEGGVWCETPEGETYFAADSVIYAVGQRALAAEASALHDCAPYFYPVGDCVLPRNIAEANTAARVVAEDIGRL